MYVVYSYTESFGLHMPFIGVLTHVDRVGKLPAASLI